MKMVVNRCYGGFCASEEVVKRLGLESPYSADRYDSKLIDIIEHDLCPYNGAFASLEVVEIPDEATDYYINDYDGIESVLYVLDGHIQWA